MNKDKARSEIERLVEKYNKVVEDNRVKQYNEEMTKIGFIQPLFRALGWNFEDSREVTAEEKISKGRVDYGFRIDGISKFFLEAKPLKADLDNEKYFEQAISYAWHKGCTWAVLTDFEAIKILNAEVKAANYMQSRFITITCDEFIDRFDELWLLSKESFEKGLLDKKAEKWGKKSKKASIDEQLLEDFTRYRRMLTKSITKLNQKQKLTEDELDESVQRILDRLIFIRNCEDRELEQKLLISKLREWESKGRGKLVNSLREVFDYFTEEYDSKIFSEHLCDNLEIENEVISEIIKGLYYIKEKYFAISYDFSVIDADVLGNIYEQYLSNILKKTAKRAKVTKNGRHRKEQGIYYTPTYIVDYIVRNTLGELLEQKRINAEKIKLLDPACGSGSFLIKAFDVFDEYYKKNMKDYGQTQFDKQRIDIPFTKKAKILKDNVFGVDLDKQAVEIAQLNLLLKITEKGHRLPMLEKNIKCGNSLIDDEKIAGEKAFQWEEEFNPIFQKGGFDVIIGNPPYVDIKQLDADIVKFLFDHYSTVENRMNLYSTFMEKALSLLKEGGYFGFIVPNSVLYNKSYSKLRELLLNNVTFRKIVRLPDNVFEDAKIETVIIIYQKTPVKNEKCQVLVYQRTDEISSISEENCEEVNYLDQKNWNAGSKIINITASPLAQKILKKIENKSTKLVDLCDFSLGLTPYDKYKGHTTNQITNKVFHSTTKKNSTFKPLLSGKNIVRYGVFWDEKKYISYGDWLGAPREKRFFTEPRIVVRQIISGKPPRIYAGYTEEELYNTQVGFNLINTDNRVRIKYILAILNSNLMNFYHKEKFLDPTKHLFQKILIVNAKKFPIKIVDEPQQQEIVELVDKILLLNKRLNEIGDKITDERARIEKKIEKIDRQIDELVYKIYGITEKEQKIIEGSL